MLAQDAYELVERCYEYACCLLDKEEIKQAFIEYVFTDYQEEVVADYGLDRFYQHLDELKLTHCRKDFDLAVEGWYEIQHTLRAKQEGYHETLFQLVKEVVATNHPKTRKELIQGMTSFLTSPNGWMKSWKGSSRNNSALYFKHLDKLGIRTYQDIEALVDAWLIEVPNAFEPYQQKHLSKPSRRGRPNNVELSLLIDKVKELKPDLTRREQERLRKIYYYHRKTLTTYGMMEKFMKYISSKSKGPNTKPRKNKNSTQVG